MILFKYFLKTTNHCRNFLISWRSSFAKSFSVLTIVALVFVTLLLPFLAIPPSPAQASWYSNDTNWRYRQKYTIANSGSALSDYQFLLSEEMLARWKFDEGSDSTIADSSGYASNGSITGLGAGISWSSSGNYSNALSFDGTSSNYVNMGNPSYLNPIEKYVTISAWFKTSSTNQMRILSKGFNSYSLGYMLEINNGNLFFGLGSGTQSSSLYYGTSGTSYADDAWHQVAVTLQPSTTTAKIYVDGIAKDITKVADTCGTVSSSSIDFGDCNGNIKFVSSSNLYFGRDNSAASYAWNGLLDESRIFNRALSATEVSYLYSNNFSPLLKSHLYSNSKSDGADLRFTTSDGSTNIPYSIELFNTSGQNARIWLKVPTIAASGNTNIYIYYNNEVATSASSAASTHTYYDDFNDNSMSSDWTVLSGRGSITEGSSAMNFSYDATGLNDWWTPAYGGRQGVALKYNNLPSGDFWAQIKLNSYTVGERTHAGISAYESDELAYIYGRMDGATNDDFRVDKIGGLATPPSYPSTTLPAILGIKKTSSGFSFHISYNNLFWEQVGDTYNDITFSNIVLFGKSWFNAALSFSEDDFMVRKYTSTVPTIALNGDYDLAESSLSFKIEGVASGQTHNGITTNIPSDFSSISFGKLEMVQTLYASHKLTVASNAIHGYTVTVKLDGYIQGLYPANKIDPFSATDVSWLTPKTWSSPNGTTQNSDSGWIGANTSDTRVSGWSSASGKFGPVSSTAHTVMESSGMDAGTTAYVSYALEINEFQPPDSYAGTMVYNVLPTY